MGISFTLVAKVSSRKYCSVRVREGKGVRRGMGWGRVSCFPCQQLAYALSGHSHLTVYFNFPFIINARPSDHKADMYTVIPSDSGR